MKAHCLDFWEMSTLLSLEIEPIHILSNSRWRFLSPISTPALIILFLFYFIQISCWYLNISSFKRCHCYFAYLRARNFCVLPLYCTSLLFSGILNILYFLVKSLGLSKSSIELSANYDNLTSFPILIPFMPISYLSSMAGKFNAILNNSENSRNPRLCLILSIMLPIFHHWVYYWM